MEKQLKYVLLLSLKEMTLRRVAVLLWSGSDILVSISKFRHEGSGIEESTREWLETIEPKIKDKVLKLELPKSLTEQMIDIVRPIGLQIKRWKESQEYHLGIEIQEIILPNSAKLCWTSAGSINNRKTAEELVRCDVLDVVQRYKLACINCLEDYIPLLWEKLPENVKEFYYNDKYLSPDLQFCWPRIFKGELSKLDYLLRTSDRNLTTFNQWAFEHSAGNGNKTAAEYFFHKLTHEEREASLMRTVKAVFRNRFVAQFRYLSQNEELSEILCYLLSVMSPEKQIEIFKERPIDVLWLFLDWPRQDLFLENAGLLWTFLLPSAFGDLLYQIVKSFTDSYPWFPKLFQDFFIQSSLDFKNYFVDEPEFNSTCSPTCNFLSVVPCFEDSETIEVILRNVDAAARVKFVFYRPILNFFYKCVLKDKWHRVEGCLREAALSKEDRKRWKEAFTVFFLKRSFGRECVNRKFKRFFEFFDETDASSDKLKKAQKCKFESCCPK
ncbi:hypothetical protein AVEN_133763-1 [Araneus ventricosus]|uniref:Uncharacterized protein n=1 Tax=Araneus ventricosus TaxID=182803 RepID=A0A4Y2RW73_ARAVE|nr:hypothetical protein AVEN_133763-1 [Araneus ventricosus]